MSGWKIDFTDDEIIAAKKNVQKCIVIYSAMWKEPKKAKIIYVSDAYIKYAKPYAVQNILDEI